MAGLRIFVSSTCYDLSILRAQLRLFIESMGYVPIMSDYEDILYDPRIHIHTSCLDEINNCDILILIIGSRFGNKGSIEALNKINFEKLKSESLNVEALKQKECLSVTQLEVLKGIENSIPVYTFIEKRVDYDYKLYEKNKSNDFIDKIEFPSIERQDIAKYIFNFINFIHFRTKGNNIFTFEKTQDIEDTLRKQWSGYFQRLLYEQRFNVSEGKQIDNLSQQFVDLKTAILSSFNVDQREVASGIVKYRRLFEFIFGLRLLDINYLKSTKDSWDFVLKKANITEIREISNKNSFSNSIIRSRTFLIKNDGTFFEARLSEDIIKELSIDWDNFIKMKSSSKDIIIDTLSEMVDSINLIRFINKKFENYYNELIGYQVDKDSNLQYYIKD